MSVANNENGETQRETNQRRRYQQWRIRNTVASPINGGGENNEAKA
jgi:hypothetical protein